MPVTSTGIKTHRDDLVIDFATDVLLDRIRRFIDPDRSDASVRSEFFRASAAGRYAAGDNRDWSMSRARRALQLNTQSLQAFVRTLEYRPFDRRPIFYHPSVIDFPREELMSEMAGGQNLGLVATRQVPNGAFCHVFVTRHLAEMKTCSHDRGTNLFPLWVGRGDGAQAPVAVRRANFSASFLSAVASCLGRAPNGPDGVPSGFSAEDVLGYVYAVTHSPHYRQHYLPDLRIGFPIVPVPKTASLFEALVKLGRETIALHLMESTRRGQSAGEYTGPKRPIVERVGWSDRNVSSGLRHSGSQFSDYLPARSTDPAG